MNATLDEIMAEVVNATPEQRLLFLYYLHTIARKKHKAEAILAIYRHKTGDQT